MNYIEIAYTGKNTKTRISKRTAKKIETARNNGAKIIVNKNYHSPKGYKKTEKLCQTNTKKSGWPKHVIWAVWN